MRLAKQTSYFILTLFFQLTKKQIILILVEDRKKMAALYLVSVVQELNL